MEEHTAGQQSINRDIDTNTSTILVSDLTRSAPAVMSTTGPVYRSESDLGLSSSSATGFITGNASGYLTNSSSGPGSSVSSVTALEDRPSVSGVHLLVMCMERNNRPNRTVTFHEGVIDNEFMNRRKSKCCCIYHKPHAFGESSSSTDDECENCCGHPEVRVLNRLKKQQCGCRSCHSHSQPEAEAQADAEPVLAAGAAPSQLEQIVDTEVAGDASDNVKVKEETSSLSLVASAGQLDRKQF